MTQKLFLPGAGGSASFWRPVMERLPVEWDCYSFSWPGLGAEPHDPNVQGIDDLVSLVLAKMGDRADLIAQSMGGLVALKVALRAPDKVGRLILAGTSGGLPVERLGGAEWRLEYRAQFPNALSWITEICEDLSDQLPAVTAPTLLLWGDRDPISPMGVAKRLGETLPHASLRIIEGGDHDFPETHPQQVAQLVRQHLG